MDNPKVAKESADQKSGLSSTTSETKADQNPFTEEYLVKLSNKFRKGVVIKNRTYRLKSYKSCFVGSEAVDWIVAESDSILDRETAVHIGQLIMNLGVFEHCVDSKKPFLDGYFFYVLRDPGFLTLNDIAPVPLNDINGKVLNNSKTTELIRKADSQGLDASPGSIDVPMPLDESNKELIELCNPTNYTDPTPKGRYNLVIIGAGAAGLVTAAGSAGLGAKVAIIDKNFLGGDCLVTGCVPSKALLASGRRFREIQKAEEFGITVTGASIDFQKVMARMRKIRAHIAHHDSVSRFTELGCDVFKGHAKFLGTDKISVNGKILSYSRAVIATGGSPSAPPIKGLSEVGYLTNESLFNLTEQPKRLGIIGAGPIGCEMAQAFAWLGTKVSLLCRSEHILKREDPDAAAIVEKSLLSDGISIFSSVKYQSVSKNEETGEYSISIVKSGVESVVKCDQILVATGRIPNVSGLNLEKAGVEFDLKTGIKVDDFLKTTNSSIYACGDCIGLHQFTHACNYQARIVIRNSLFFGFARVSSLLMPWVTYTHPEIAHVGLYEPDIESPTTYTKTFEEHDRALCEGSDYTSGIIKVHVQNGKDRILGATVVSPNAGDLINEFSIAMRSGMGLKTLSTVIHPYPTISEAIPMVGDLFNRSKLTPTAQKFLGGLLEMRR